MFEIKCEEISGIPPKRRYIKYVVYDIKNYMDENNNEIIKFLIYDAYWGWRYIDSKNCEPISY